MVLYRVKAILDIEYDAIRSDKTSSAWEEAESQIIAALSKLEFLSSCEFKKAKIQSEDY